MSRIDHTTVDCSAPRELGFLDQELLLQDSEQPRAQAVEHWQTMLKKSKE